MVELVEQREGVGAAAAVGDGEREDLAVAAIEHAGAGAVVDIGGQRIAADTVLNSRSAGGQGRGQAAGYRVNAVAAGLVGAERDQTAQGAGPGCVAGIAVACQAADVAAILVAAWQCLFFYIAVLRTGRRYRNVVFDLDHKRVGIQESDRIVILIVYIEYARKINRKKLIISLITRSRHRMIKLIQKCKGIFTRANKQCKDRSIIVRIIPRNTILVDKSDQRISMATTVSIYNLITHRLSS